MEQELRTTDSLARTSSTGGGRVRCNVPETLANRLGPLAMEMGATAPVAPSSDVREQLWTTPPPPRRQPLESLGRSIDQSQTSSQTISRTSNQPATATAASTGNPSTGATPAEEVEPCSVLLWNRPEPSGCGQYKKDMSTNLSMNILTCRMDAKRIMVGDNPTVSGLYRIPGVDWLLAEQDQFSSATTLRFVDRGGLPQDNTFGPLNTRSLTDVRRRARELSPPSQRDKFVTENKPNISIIRTSPTTSIHSSQLVFNVHNDHPSSIPTRQISQYVVPINDSFIMSSCRCQRFRAHGYGADGQ